jgi:hypothetical protein
LSSAGGAAGHGACRFDIRANVTYFFANGLELRHLSSLASSVSKHAVTPGLQASLPTQDPVMLARRQSLPKKRAGAHIVEFAVVAPFFFLFIFALIDIGRGMMVSSILSHVARAGCRTGVLPGKSNTDVQAAIDLALQGTGVTGTTTTAKVNGSVADVNTANTKDLITVSVSVPVGNITWLPTTWFVAGTLSGQFSLEHE